MKKGFFQALGIVAYITFVGTFMSNAKNLFPRPDNFLTPIVVLTLFSTSVLICAIIVFFQPYKLFISGKKKEALNVVLSTAGFLSVLLIMFLTLLLIFK